MFDLAVQHSVLHAQSMHSQTDSNVMLQGDVHTGTPANVRQVDRLIQIHVTQSHTDLSTQKARISLKGLKAP